MPAFLTLPYGILWEFVKPSDFVLVTFDGKILRDSKRSTNAYRFEPDYTAIKIHGQIHKLMGPKKAKAVFHTHQPYTTALTCLKGPQSRLRMVH